MYQSKKPYLYGTGRRKSSVARVRIGLFNIARYTASMPLLPSALPPKGEARRYIANDFLNLMALPERRMTHMTKYDFFTIVFLASMCVIVLTK